jgi:methionyl-tRNA formyltransferase
MKRVVFAGTPEFAVPCLNALSTVGGIEVVAAYTQPDRPAGRGRVLTASPVKQRALELGIPVLQPETLRDSGAQEQLRALAPQLMVVVAYGLILPKKVLSIPEAGCWNIHASLLPRWRGAAPIHRAIAAGDTETGVCLMQMDAGLDTGGVLLHARCPILSDTTTGTLHDQLAQMGAAQLTEGISRWLAGSLPAPEAQSEEGVCYAHKIEKHEGELSFELSAEELDRRIRAFTPWPGAFLSVAGERVQVLAAQPIAWPESRSAGEFLAMDARGCVIACSKHALAIKTLRAKSGKVMSAEAFANGKQQWRVRS